MDEILYLVHTTYNFDYNWKELKTTSINNIQHQYPGVYLSLITKKNINKEELYGYNEILIFSKKLLEQENYHINIRDYNGYINEKNTYFPWELDKVIKKLNKPNKYNIGNEVIFHDPIPLKYLCMIINVKSINNNINKNKLLPNIEIYNDEPADKTKIPFYCVPLEENYTGIGKYKLSSKKFYEKMAILCNINKNQSRKKIIEEIKNKMFELYNNRNKQKIKEFKELFK